MGEGLCLFSVSSTLLVKDKPLRGAYASLTSVVDTLLLKQAISPSLCIVDATNRNGPRVAAFTGRLVHIHRTGGRILPDRWCWQNVICKTAKQEALSLVWPFFDYYDAADHPIRRRLSQAFHEMGAKCSEPQGASIRWV